MAAWYPLLHPASPGPSSLAPALGTGGARRKGLFCREVLTFPLPRSPCGGSRRAGDKGADVGEREMRQPR